MKVDASSRRQNELLTELLSQIRARVDGHRELEQAWQESTESIGKRHAAKRQETSRALLLQHDECENEYKRELVAARDEFDAQLQTVKSEANEKLAAARKQTKTVLSDGEYDWFLSKQRLRKEFAHDELATYETYKATKSDLKLHGQAYNGLAKSVKATLANHHCELKIQGGDLLEPPGAGNHLAAHHQTCLQIKELVRQFQRTFWVRFQDDRWYLIVFLVSVVVFAYPLHMILGSFALTGIATAFVGIACCLISWAISRSLANKVAHQFRESLVTAIATGKSQLLAAQHQNKSHRDGQLKLLADELRAGEQDLDREWTELQATTNRQLTRREDELKTWAHKRAQSILRLRKDQEELLADQFVPRLNELRQRLQIRKQELAQQESGELGQWRSEHEQKLAELAHAWQRGIASAIREADDMCKASELGRADLTLSASEWNPPTECPDIVRFGHVDIDITQLPGGVADDGGVEVSGTKLQLPATIDLRHAPSLLIEASTGTKEKAAHIMRAVMLRLLTSFPPGKLRFTIVDPVGLGQDFSAFMHLGDFDEQLISHRIWTESNHINAQLTVLTQHMENVIQTYLRNEFDSIQDYNAHAGEVAEPYRALVVANFPTAFSEETASRLLSIASSGPRCGVFVLLIADPQHSMPRNFDLDELRQHTNVLVTSNVDARWAEPPLSGFPVCLDGLPSEDQISALMQTVGERAKDASRVEVPFSAVAAPNDDWWTADSRGGLSVPLGRVGAKKLQRLELGHGTSQHVLVSGKTGSGKSTLLHALITNVALRYSPDEVQFYLIDFKKGVEFKAYAEYKLPHARVIAIESEREFGQSVLQRLDAELRRRGDLFRRVGVQSIAGYRDARPDEHMPRVLLVIDEFQEFFVKEDKISQDASLLLDRLVRQGRAFGIHVMLGSQTLAGAYSLARATIGQMAIRIALQCSATDAHLILSDDNDAARLLRRPGDAIYNDANGTVEGNHPFQVVWLTDVEKEGYLRELSERQAASERELDEPIVFEGNVAADPSRNAQLTRSWEAPAPAEIPLAPRAWLGDAIAIKDAPAVVFHRRSGANLMLVGQQEEAALGVMATSLLSLAAFSPTSSKHASKFLVLDGARPEGNEAGYWPRFKEMTGLDISILKPRDAADAIRELAAEVNSRHQQDDDQRAATFLCVYNLARFASLRKTDDFGFGGFDDSKPASLAEDFAAILRDGPTRGVHTILWSDTHTNLMRWIDRQSLRDMESRLLFQMSATDSSNLMDSSAASQLGAHRAILYSEDQGRAERFRPYGLPGDDFLLKIRSLRSRTDRHPAPR